MVHSLRTQTPINSRVLTFQNKFRTCNADSFGMRSVEATMQGEVRSGRGGLF